MKLDLNHSRHEAAGVSSLINETLDTALAQAIAAQPPRS